MKKTCYTCPKCGSERIAFAHDEAPAWAKHWTKCFACGKRWNLDGGPPKRTGDDEEESGESAVVRAPPTRTGEDIVKLVMDLSRQRRPGQKTQSIEMKEATMRPRCTKGTCQDEAAEDSVRCPTHRDAQWASNMKFKGGAVPAEGKPTRKYTRRIQLGGDTAVATLPATRSPAPLVMAEPTMVNAKPARGMDLNGNVVTILDSVIEQLRADLATLHGAKEIMQRHS